MKVVPARRPQVSDAGLETGYPEKICHHDGRRRRQKHNPLIVGAQFSFWSFFLDFELMSKGVPTALLQNMQRVTTVEYSRCVKFDDGMERFSTHIRCKTCALECHAIYFIVIFDVALSFSELIQMHRYAQKVHYAKIFLIHIVR